MITEFSLFVFTALGGVGAGLYVAATVFPPEGRRNNLLVSIVPLACLGIGGVALLLHLGHPERMFNAFANPQAGITQEAFASMAFGAVLVVDLALTFFKGAVPRWLRIVGAVLAVALCTVMGMTYFNYESQAAWHAVSTVPFFLVIDLAVGFAFLRALYGSDRGGRPLMWACVVLLAIAAVVFAAEAPLFALFPGVMPFACAAVIAAVAAVVEYAASKREGVALPWLAFVLAFVAMVVARYAFYSII